MLAFKELFNIYVYDDIDVKKKAAGSIIVKESSKDKKENDYLVDNKRRLLCIETITYCLCYYHIGLTKGLYKSSNKQDYTW